MKVNRKHKGRKENPNVNYKVKERDLENKGEINRECESKR